MFVGIVLVKENCLNEDRPIKILLIPTLPCPKVLIHMREREKEIERGREVRERDKHIGTWRTDKQRLRIIERDRKGREEGRGIDKKMREIN